LNVPLIFYKKGSAINSSHMPTGWPNFTRDIQNLDIAPTLSAILGIPVPRESQGRFVEDALLFANQSTLSKHYYDLFIQKQLLAREFAIESEVLSYPTMFSVTCQ